MKTTPRWIAPLLAEAAACKVRLPWERGLRRAAMIARRRAAAAEAPARSPAPAAVRLSA